MHHAYEECKKDAEALSIAAVGTEVVGLVPLASILQAAEYVPSSNPPQRCVASPHALAECRSRYYMAKESLFLLQEEHKVRLAIERLGLSSVAAFDPQKRIIEYVVGQAWHSIAYGRIVARTRMLCDAMLCGGRLPPSPSRPSPSASSCRRSARAFPPLAAAQRLLSSRRWALRVVRWSVG